MTMQDMTYAVPEPVGRRGQTNTARSNGKREDLADDDPGRRAPSCSEEEDVQADECDHGADSCVIVLRCLASSYANDTNNELHDDHARGTVNKDGASTKSLDNVERYWSRTDIDERGDQTDQKRVLDRAELLEKNSSKVEDEVNTRQLLHHLHTNTEKS